MRSMCNDDHFWCDYMTVNYTPQSYGYKSFLNMKLKEKHDSYKNIFKDIVYPSKLFRSNIWYSGVNSEEKYVALSINDTANDIVNRIRELLHSNRYVDHIEIYFVISDNFVFMIKTNNKARPSLFVRSHKFDLLKEVNSNDKVGQLCYDDRNIFDSKSLSKSCLHIAMTIKSLNF
jgi:hypothetical protein